MLVRKLLVVAAVIGILSDHGQGVRTKHDEPEKPKSLSNGSTPSARRFSAESPGQERRRQALETPERLGNAPEIGIAREGSSRRIARLDVARRLGRRARRSACGQHLFAEAKAEHSGRPPTTIPL